MKHLDLISVLSSIPDVYHEVIKSNSKYEEDGFFQNITDPAEIKDYQQWAREKYKPEDKIEALWHPIVVAECIQIIKEFNEGNGI